MTPTISTRTSWDTAVKHLARKGLLSDVLTSKELDSIPKSNFYRWKNEPEDKYQLCQINQLIDKEIELIKRLNKSSKIKAINQSYFKLCDVFHQIISKVKGVKTLIKEQKELVVNTIDLVKEHLSINDCIKVFNISKTTYQNYKSLVIHQCEASYFKWCVKRFSHQLLPKEIKTIKTYLEDQQCRYWSKSSIFFKAKRDQKLFCGLSTFYKYARLLGFNGRPSKKKNDFYSPIKTSKANQLWCADVTIFKTANNQKYYIHLLMDHFSKKILGAKVENRPSGVVIRDLLIHARETYRPENIQFLTDGGSENVNHNIRELIEKSKIPISHLVAQKDVIFSNSMIEALNKTIKHQFLYPKTIQNKNQLISALEDSVEIYNNIRPQLNLKGNTPEETFIGIPMDINQYKTKDQAFRDERLAKNKKNRCNNC